MLVKADGKGVRGGDCGKSGGRRGRKEGANCGGKELSVWSYRTLWARVTEHPDSSTGPLARPFARGIVIDGYFVCVFFSSGPKLGEGGRGGE